MNYIDSSEYKEWKDELCEDYKEKFLMIEQYYLQADRKESYEVQLTLSQILGDFLLAQRADKPLERITGKDIKKYAIRMLQAEYDSDKGKSYWISSVVLILWLILFLMIGKTFFFGQYSDLSLVEKLNHIYFSLYIVPIIMITFIAEYVKAKGAAFLFFRPRLIFYFRFLFTLPVTVIVIQYLGSTYTDESFLVVRISPLLFLALAVAATIYLTVICIISLKKTNTKKRELGNPMETISIEQIPCPSCGKEHDCDDPKCPYCGDR
jgi:DNA-binding ferritin-like protein (Dps family)